MRQRLPDGLGDERHERVQQLHCAAQHIAQHLLYVLVAGLQTGLCNFDIPVAEVLPDEVVQLGSCQTQLVLVDVAGNVGYQRIELADDPLILDGKVARQLDCLVLVDGQVHLDKAGCVPDLVAEVAGRLYALIRETHVVSGAVAGCEGEAQRVRAVLVDDLERVDAVAERLGHLAALRVAHQTVDINRLERGLAHVLHTGEDHASNPEEDNIIAGNERRGRVEIVKLLGLVRPAERGERPQSGREPGIQYVLLLMDMRAAALRAGAYIGLGDGHFAAVLTVERRNAVTPPQLTGDTPVVYIFHPAQVGLGEAVGHELGLALVYYVHRGLGERRHLDEPLRRGHRLNGGAAAVAGAYVVLVVLNLDQPAAFLKVLYNRLAALVAVHALVLAAVCVDGRVLVEHENLLEVMALTHLEVVRVVARRNLNTAGAELHINVLVTENRNLAVHDREDAGLADEVLVALVVRVDSNAGIAHEGLRTGGRNHQLARAVRQRIADVPQLARLGFVLNLSVGQRSRAVRAPVDDAVALVDKALVVQVYEYLADRLGAALVHGEALAVPVAGGTELFKLADNAAAELVLPRPYALKELLAAEVVTGQALLLAEVLLYFDLGCNTGVIGARHPQRLVALHALGADEDILQGLVECVAHVQLAGNIRRRDNDGVRFLVRIDLGVEEAGIDPELVQLVLDRFRVVGLRQFAH